MTLSLAFGFSFADLYDTAALSRLDGAFLDELQKTDTALANQLLAARAAPSIRHPGESRGPVFLDAGFRRHDEEKNSAASALLRIVCGCQKFNRQDSKAPRPEEMHSLPLCALASWR